MLVQTATGHEGLETYGNSIPIIHSVFHNSVENQAPKMPQALVLCNFPSKKCCGHFCGSSGKKIRGLLRTVPILSTFPKQIFEGFGEQNPAYIRVKIRP